MPKLHLGTIGWSYSFGDATFIPVKLLRRIFWVIIQGISVRLKWIVRFTVFLPSRLSGIGVCNHLMAFCFH